MSKKVKGTVYRVFWLDFTGEWVSDRTFPSVMTALHQVEYWLRQGHAIKIELHIGNV